MEMFGFVLTADFLVMYPIFGIMTMHLELAKSPNYLRMDLTETWLEQVEWNLRNQITYL